MDKRFVLKLSGEGLAGNQGFGFDPDILSQITSEIREANQKGFQLAIVVGGGNFIRGAKLAPELGIGAAEGHYMGMLATVINGIALSQALESLGVDTRLQSVLPVDAVAEKYILKRCRRHLDKGRVVIVAGGTGRPFVTTDTAAALLAAEIGASKLFKATNVDGVYDADPRSNASAVRYDSLDHDRVIDERLKFIDLSAVDLCQQNGVQILVFDLHQRGNLLAACQGRHIGTLVHSAI